MQESPKESSKTKQELLDEYFKGLEWCNSCKLMGKKVWDNGNPDADLMIIAEAPGADEEAKGVPLIGRCGKLVEEMLNHIGLSRAETWRANCLVCRPPNNRDPLSEEIDGCIDHLVKQVEIIKPKVIVVLGRFAAQTILGVTTPISKLVNKWYESQNKDIDLFVTYHPSYILRNGDSLVGMYRKHFEEVKGKLDEIRSSNSNAGERSS